MTERESWHSLALDALLIINDPAMKPEAKKLAHNSILTMASRLDEFVEITDNLTKALRKEGLIR